MKVGVLIEFTSNTDIDAKFAELKEMGVDSCQLVCWDRPTLQDDAMAESINKGLEKYGIHATAFWCGWEGRRVWDFYEGQLTLGLIPSDYRVERLKMLMEGSDFDEKDPCDRPGNTRWLYAGKSIRPEIRGSIGCM